MLPGAPSLRTRSRGKSTLFQDRDFPLLEGLLTVFTVLLTLCLVLSWVVAPALPCDNLWSTPPTISPDTKDLQAFDGEAVHVRYLMSLQTFVKFLEAA